MPFVRIDKAGVVIICFEIAPRSSAPVASRDQAAQGDAMLWPSQGKLLPTSVFTGLYDTTFPKELPLHSNA